MMFLRLLCLAAGVLVLVVPPVLLFPIGAATPQARFALVFLVCMALASTGFFLISMAGHRMRRSPLLRSLAALLLAPPCLASLAMLWRGGAPALLWMCSLMLVVTLVLYLTLVYPVVRSQGHRPLRRPEPREPQLSALPHR